MKSLMLPIVAGAALLVGATAANAQYYHGDGYYGRPMVERGVGLQLGPVGIGVYGPGYEQPYGYQSYGYQPYGYTYGQRRARDNSTYNSEAFRSQELLPQSPPGGGY